MSGLSHADLVERLTVRLQQPLPGLAAQRTMAPFGRNDDPAMISVDGKTNAREAATLVLLYPFGETEEPALVLTARQPSLRDHSGQVSFPGGRRETGETAEETALREGWEEVGVDPDVPRVLGRLTPLYIPPSRFAVYPVVATVEGQPAFAPQEEEVAAILDVPLARLLDPATRQTSIRSVRGGTFETPYFALHGYEVWGATAMMLAEFIAIVQAL